MEWVKQPQRLTHPILGKLQRWRSKCKRYRVDRYTDYGQGNRYLAQLVNPDDTTSLIERNKTLNAAKRSCEDHAAAADLANGS